MADFLTMTAYLQSILYTIVYLSRGLHTCTAVVSCIYFGVRQALLQAMPDCQ